MIGNVGAHELGRIVELSAGVILARPAARDPLGEFRRAVSAQLGQLEVLAASVPDGELVLPDGPDYESALKLFGAVIDGLKSTHTSRLREAIEAALPDKLARWDELHLAAVAALDRVYEAVDDKIDAMLVQDGRDDPGEPVSWEEAKRQLGM